MSSLIKKNRKIAEKLNSRVFLKPEEQQVGFEALQGVYKEIKRRITMGDLIKTNTDWNEIPDDLMKVGEAFRPIFSANKYWPQDFEWILKLQEMHRNIASKKPRGVRA
tara:strand:- start:221 stop:544 length:324 start_codon:yes stop_codon:yes gene_type:complete